jgi:multiple sugar transport system substrate-binding protein
MRGRDTRLKQSVLLIAVLGAALIAGCGGNGGSGSKTLSWFVFDEPGGAYAKAAADCSKASGGRYEIEFELLPTDASVQREQLVRRLGAEDPSIDIIGMDVIWTAEFANAGWIEEWTGERKREVTEEVFPSVIETASFEGKLYGAPFTSNTQLLWYRKDRVKSPPKTWDEMIRQAEEIGPNGTIQVQGSRYEGYTVWANALIESAGGRLLSGPTEIDLPEGAAARGIAMLGRLADSPAAADDIDTSVEDSGRLAFQTGASSFMVNYPFVYPSAEAEAPDIFKQMAAAVYPAVDPNRPSRPPLGGINLGVSSFSENIEESLEAATCLRSPKNQVIAANLGGLPPTRSDLYDTKGVQEAYPGFADLIRKSIEQAGPRPSTPAYQDVSLAVQRALHPAGSIDPEDPKPTVDDLRDLLDQAVKREGLL